MSDAPALEGLREQDLDPSPFVQFDRWFQQAVAAHIPFPDAMTLATSAKDGTPSARIVLMRGFDELGFTFYTNYESRKARDLGENPQAALVFHWRELQRQVGILGSVERVLRDESERYFHRRPRESQISACASRQSQVISSRAALEGRFAELEASYEGGEVPLPPYWGGFRLSPNAFEFWQHRENRLHDRLRYTRSVKGRWRIERLSP